MKNHERELDMHGQRGFVLLVTLAVAAAVPAWGQAIKPAGSGAQGAASIPDFSGVWAKPYVGIESPRSGPGPVTNRSRRNGARNVYQYVGDYTNPILKPEAAEIVKKHGEISLSGVPFPSPRNQCWPQGVPGIFPDTEMQMLQQPDKITILYNEDHEIHHIRMNQPHPVPVTLVAPLTTTIRARGFSFNSLLRMKASSRCPGRRP